MRIGDIDFTKYKSERKKVIVYSNHGNDIVHPYKTLYNLEQITGEESHNKLWLEVFNDAYDNKDFLLYDDLDVCIYKSNRILPDTSLTYLNSMISSYPYFGKAGFLARLAECEKKDWYVNIIDIKVCVLLGENELAQHYAVYRKTYKEKLEMRNELARIAKEKAEKEAKEAQQKEIEKALDNAEYKIFKQVDFKNNKLEDKSVINLLMQRYRIKVPLRTQGWINKKLAMIVFDDGRISYKFYGKSQRDNSKVFIDYLEELEAKINDKLHIPNY